MQEMATVQYACLCVEGQEGDAGLRHGSIDAAEYLKQGLEQGRSKDRIALAFHISTKKGPNNPLDIHIHTGCSPSSEEATLMLLMAPLLKGNRLGLRDKTGGLKGGAER